MGTQQMTPKQKAIFLRRKNRYIKEIVKNLQSISRTVAPPSIYFSDIRQNLTLLETLHGNTEKAWLTAEEVFWKKYNVQEFCDSTGIISMTDLYLCKSGHKAYSERVKEAIINYIQEKGL